MIFTIVSAVVVAIVGYLFFRYGVLIRFGIRFLTQELFFYLKKTSREEQALDYLVSNAEEGNPASVLKTLDDFSNKAFCMNIGDAKGALLDEELKKAKPKYVLELGAYLGYEKNDQDHIFFFFSSVILV